MGGGVAFLRLGDGLLDRFSLDLGRLLSPRDRDLEFSKKNIQIQQETELLENKGHFVKAILKRIIYFAIFISVSGEIEILHRFFRETGAYYYFDFRFRNLHQNQKIIEKIIMTQKTIVSEHKLIVEGEVFTEKKKNEAWSKPGSFSVQIGIFIMLYAFLAQFVLKFIINLYI